MLIHCHSPRSSVFFTGQVGKLSRDTLGMSYHPPLFKPLLWAPISATPPGIQYFFWFITFLGRGSSSGFHLGLYNMNSPHYIGSVFRNLIAQVTGCKNFQGRLRKFQVINVLLELGIWIPDYPFLSPQCPAALVVTGPSHYTKGDWKTPRVYL